MLALPPVAAGDRVAVVAAAAPRPLRPAGRQRLLGAPGGDRPPGRGRRRPGPGRGCSATGGWSPTTSGSGPGTRPSPTPSTLAAASALRRDRVGVLPPGHRAGPQVEQRCLADYDTALGLDDADGRRSADGHHDQRPRPQPGPDRRGGVPDPGVEGADAARVGAPAGRAGPGRVLDPRGVPGRLPATRGRRPGVPRRRGPDPRRPVPGPQDPGGVRLRPRPRPQTRDRSPTWAPWTSSPPRRTWCSSAHPAPARPTWPSGWRSGPARPATGCCSPPPRNGSTGSPTPTTPAGCKTSCVRLGRYPLLVVDEVGYIPFEPEAANLFFQLVSSRYERASLIVTTNKPFGRWGEVFGDDVVAAAMIDRLVHHAEVIALKGDCYRLKDRDLGRVPAATTERTNDQPGGQFSTAARGSVFGRR